MRRSFGTISALIAASCGLGIMPAVVCAQAEHQLSSKQETFRLLPDRDDPGFEPQLRRAIQSLNDPDPRQRQAATRVLAHSTSLTVDDLLSAVDDGIPLESRWRLLEAARMRFERSERAALGVQFGLFDGMTAIQNTIEGFDSNERNLLLPGDTIVSIAGVSVLRTPQQQLQARTASVVGAIQPAIIANDPGDRVRITVSRVTDPALRPPHGQMGPLQQVRPERHPDQSELERSLITVEVELGSFGNLANVGSRGPDRSAIDIAWEYRLARDGVSLGVDPIAAEHEPLPTLFPPVNIADAFSEFRSIFLAASELPARVMPEMLPDRRDTENDRRRFIAGRAQVQLNQRIAMAAARQGQPAEPALQLPGGDPTAAAALSARADLGPEDPRAAALIMHAAQLQRDIDSVLNQMSTAALNDPARGTLESRARTLRDELRHTRAELEAMPSAGRASEPADGVELTDRGTAEHDADS